MKKLIITTLLAMLFIPSMAQREVKQEEQKEAQKEVQNDKKVKTFAEIKF